MNRVHTGHLNESVGEQDVECDYCGQNDPNVNYTERKPYKHEPSSIVCEDCMEERPWKYGND
jgi:hypothetical protein